jgi:hypothetical protein
MGRAGLEPATSGLKVRLHKLKTSCTQLKDAANHADDGCNDSEMHRAETSLYAPYAQRVGWIANNEQLLVLYSGFGRC